MEGSTVNLVCEATAGDPPISYSWTGPNGQPVFPGDIDGTISVTFPAASSFGTYTCSAANEFGFDRASIEVIQACKAIATAQSLSMYCIILRSGNLSRL